MRATTRKKISAIVLFFLRFFFFFLSTVVAYSFLLDYQKGTGIFFSFFLVRSYIPIECVSVRKENWRDSRWVSETLFEMTSAMTTSTFISTFHFHLFAELWFINSDWLICISKEGKKRMKEIHWSTSKIFIWQKKRKHTVKIIAERFEMKFFEFQFSTIILITH